MARKTVLVTGASRGIGKATAILFAKKGWQTAICCRNRTEELAAVKEIIEGYDVPCLTFAGDVGDESFCEEMFRRTKEVFGHVDALINNAAISYVGLLQDMTKESWDNILRNNLTSVFLCSRAVIPDMVHEKFGKIVNISSMWGISGASCEVAYSTTKGGLNAFTKALAKELAPSNIQVNAIACGVIDTEMNSFLTDEELTSLTENIPAGRLGKAEEVADLAYHLCYQNNYLTGQIIGLDGGYL